MKCKHNNRNRYTTGYFCEDCQKFISKESDEYKTTEGITSLWCVLHNYLVENPENKEIKKMEEKVYKAYMKGTTTINLYKEALNLINNIGLNENDAIIILN